MSSFRSHWDRSAPRQSQLTRQLQEVTAKKGMNTMSTLSFSIARVNMRPDVVIAYHLTEPSRDVRVNSTSPFQLTDGSCLGRCSSNRVGPDVPIAGTFIPSAQPALVASPITSGFRVLLTFADYREKLETF